MRARRTRIHAQVFRLLDRERIPCLFPTCVKVKGTLPGAMNPAGTVRCNMRKRIELGWGDCNFRVRARFVCYDCAGHDAPGNLRYGKSRPPVRGPGGRGAFKISVR